MKDGTFYAITLVKITNFISKETSITKKLAAPQIRRILHKQVSKYEFYVIHSALFIHFVIFQTLKKSRKIRSFEKNKYDLRFKICEHNFVTRRVFSRS